MIGYCHKDSGKPWFTIHLHNISPEDVRIGRSQHALWGAGSLKNRQVLTTRNIFERCMVFAEVHTTAGIQRTMQDILCEMMQTGTYTPNAQWVIPHQGRGMSHRRANAVWKMLTCPPNVTPEDVHLVFFYEGDPGYGISGQFQANHIGHYLSQGAPGAALAAPGLHNPTLAFHDQPMDALVVEDREGSPTIAHVSTARDAKRLADAMQGGATAEEACDKLGLPCDSPAAQQPWVPMPPDVLYAELIDSGYTHTEALQAMGLTVPEASPPPSTPLPNSALLDHNLRDRTEWEAAGGPSSFKNPAPPQPTSHAAHGASPNAGEADHNLHEPADWEAAGGPSSSKDPAPPPRPKTRSRKRVQFRETSTFDIMRATLGIAGGAAAFLRQEKAAGWHDDDEGDDFDMGDLVARMLDNVDPDDVDPEILQCMLEMSD